MPATATMIDDADPKGRPEMTFSKAMSEFRFYGVVWIVMAPIAWLMASISTVKDANAYWLQLAVFTVAAAAAIVFGLAAVFRQTWARLGLITLSWMGALMFIGPGLLLLGGAVFARNWAAVLMGLYIMLFGLPFVVLAVRLQRLRLTFQPTTLAALQ